MEKEPRVFCAFRQCALHFGVRFSQIARCSQRPRQGVVSEDIAARIKFLFGQSKRSVLRLVSRREKERQCAGIAGCAALAKLRLDRGRFIFAPIRAQRFGERPLIFRKRI
jgi:hypothetical protein